MRKGTDTWPECIYNADLEKNEREEWRKRGWICKPAINMPRWASRITLEITDIRAEQLQDISEGDAIDEGIEPPRCQQCGYTLHEISILMDHHLCGEAKPPSAIPILAALWDDIYAKHGCGWDTNPWTWVIIFKLVELITSKQDNGAK